MKIIIEVTLRVYDVILNFVQDIAQTLIRDFATIFVQYILSIKKA
jgi:hypothetical protein